MKQATESLRKWMPDHIRDAAFSFARLRKYCASRGKRYPSTVAGAVRLLE